MAEKGAGSGVARVRAATARPAATVMVVRDGPQPSGPLEVLMLRRTVRAEFAAGAYVFPGGAVDPEDGSPRAARLCRGLGGLGDAAASDALGVESGGLAYWVAAARECFEEAGLLFALHADGSPVTFAEPGTRRRFARHRAAVNAGERSFLEVCEAEGLSLSVGAFHHVAHWITPEGAPRRYDTRFFVAAAPVGQTPAHDAGETVSDVWVRPADALERHRAGAMHLVLPTTENLRAIGRYETAESLLAAASRTGEVPTVLPRLLDEGGVVRVLLPGDPGYDSPVGAGEATGGG